MNENKELKEKREKEKKRVFDFKVSLKKITAQIPIRYASGIIRSKSFSKLKAKAHYEHI